MVIEDQDSIWRSGYTANQRYTKDLEDMLRRIVACATDRVALRLIITEAKTLLERTGYTDEF